MDIFSEIQNLLKARQKNVSVAIKLIETIFLKRTFQTPKMFFGEYCHVFRK